MKKVIPFLFCVLLMLFTSCRSKTDQAPSVFTLTDWLEVEAESYLDTMTLPEKASQVLMTGIWGYTQFTASLKDYYSECVPGAILLFSYNIGSTPETVHSFLWSSNESFSKLGAKIPVFFAIDHEGGDVYRLGSVSTRLPSAKFISEKMSLNDARQLYANSMEQLVRLGIHINLAPVAEVSNGENSVFLGSRLYSGTGAEVRDYCGTLISSANECGLITAVKHFPGNTATDPHSHIASLNIESELLKKDIIPHFKHTLSYGSDFLLVSHAIVPAVEAGLPFSLSQRAISQIVRKDLGFKGVVLTDDITMKALRASGYTSQIAAVKALTAGCDMIMTSDPDILSIRNAIVSEAFANPDFSDRLDEAVTRILLVKIKTGLLPTRLRKYALSRYSATSPRGFDLGAYRKLRMEGNSILEEYGYGK